MAYRKEDRPAGFEVTTPETVGQFADAVRAAVDAERERIKAIVREDRNRSPWEGLIYADEILRRIEEGR